jgi:hypothetical protein
MVKTITMAELKKLKAPSPQDLHRQRVGKGNFNRWNSLSDDSRRPSFSGKRQLEISSSPPPDAPAKAPRLDSNMLFEQMKAHEGKLKEAKTILEEAVKAKADADLDNNNLLDDGTNSCISKMLLVLTALVAHSEGLSSSIIDMHSSGYQPPKQVPPNNTRRNLNAEGNYDDPPPIQRGRANTSSRKKELTQDEITIKKIRQEITKAEKSTTIFDVDLGQVPIINKDTLSGKFTQTIHAAAATSDEVKKGNYSTEDAGEILDDVLTCANMEILGNGGSKKYYNRLKPSDPLNGKFCTVPIKLTFKTKEERVKAEQSLRKFSKVKCSVPYPKKLRTIIGNLVKEGKKVKPDTYIKVKVDTEKMKVSALASIRNDSGRWTWQDLNISHDIPLDILEQPDKVTLEAMDHDSEQAADEGLQTL